MPYCGKLMNFLDKYLPEEPRFIGKIDFFAH